MERMKRFSLRCLIIAVLLFALPVSGAAPAITVSAAVSASVPSLNVSKKTLYTGYKPYTLKVKNLAKNASVTYKSSNTKVAKVTSKGKVTPVAKGTATVTATIKQNGKTYTSKTKITVNTPSLTLTDRTSTLAVGEQFTFRAETSGMDAKVTWSVSDSSIAAINKTTGKVTAKSAGTVTVTAKAGGKTKTYRLKVTGSADKIPADPSKELSAKEIYDKCAPATVEIHAELTGMISQGSGFFIDDGVVVTNYHVIDGAKKIEVLTQDNKVYKVDKILGYDKKIDIAILKIPSANQSLTLNENGVSVGETVYALGSPLGLTGTLTDGIVSTASRKSDGVDYIQITAAISSGNSGGPLLNTYGEVMGINSMTIVEGQNLNFAINISELGRIKTDSPVSVSEFYQSNEIQDTTDITDNGDYLYLFEDTAKSADLSTCQDVPSEAAVLGQLTPDSMLDYYHIRLNRKTQVSAVLLSPDDNVTDLVNMYFVMIDSHDNMVLESDFAEDYSYQYFYDSLPAGDYYIVVFPTEDYFNKITDYCFSVIY